jgi:hypothetical protein
MIRGMRRLFAALLFIIATASATDWTGIWAGSMAGRKGETEDVAFQFQMKNGQLAGKMFGDEFDLPAEGISVVEGKLKFIISSMNYYSRVAVKHQFTAEMKGSELVMTRERIPDPASPPPKEAPSPQSFTLKRLAVSR